MTTTTRRRRRKDQQLKDFYAVCKSGKLLDGHMELRGHSCASLADAVTAERLRVRKGKTCSRQMISYLKTGKLRSCEPDLAEAIESVLNVLPGTIFDVLPKSRETRENLKARARDAA